MWLADMLKEKHGYTQAAATCEYPHSLQGRSLMSINKDDFHCGMRGFVLFCCVWLLLSGCAFLHLQQLAMVWTHKISFNVCLTIRSVAGF